MINDPKQTTQTPVEPSMPWIVLGGGGHAKVLIHTLSKARASILGVVDPQLKIGTQVLGYEVLGDDSKLFTIDRPFHVTIGVGANPSVRLRRTIFEKLRSKDLSIPSVISPTADISAYDVIIEEAAQILTGVIIHPSTFIGTNTVVNTGSIIEHDVNVGAHGFISPNVTVCGGVSIGENCFIGASATILPGITLGEGVCVGANATVCNDVPPHTTVVGTPALAREKEER